MRGNDARQRLARLEQRHGTEQRVTRIFITDPDGAGGVVMERQASGRWKHYPINDAEDTTP